MSDTHDALERQDQVVVELTARNRELLGTVHGIRDELDEILRLGVESVSTDVIKGLRARLEDA